MGAMAVQRRTGARATRLGVAAVATAVTGWSAMNVIPKIAHLPAITFAFYRLWMGAVVMLVTMALARRRLTWAMIRVSAPGGVLFGLNVVVFLSALRQTSVADVLVIGALQPAITQLVAGPLFGERVTRHEVGWMAASVAGVVLVVIGSSGTPVWSLRGDLLAVVSLLMFTLYFLVSKRVRSGVPAVQYMTAVTVVAAAVVTPVALLSGRSLGAVRAADWWWLALFLVGAQGGHVLIAWAHAQVDVSVSSLFILAEPILSALAALIVLGEPLGPLAVLGGFVVVGSIAAIVRRATRPDGRLHGPGEPVAAPPGGPAP
jgi:drug/metabolite transporter (DMT)-like permease